MVYLQPAAIYITVTNLLGFKFTDFVNVLGYSLLDILKNFRVIE
jgi:hypothetical protein